MLTPPPTAQCGRTFTHDRHDTDRGTCYGLDGTETTRPLPGLLQALHRAVAAARADRRARGA